MVEEYNSNNLKNRFTFKVTLNNMRKVMKEKWTPERKAKMSQRMKDMRKERGRNWRKEK